MSKSTAYATALLQFELEGVALPADYDNNYLALYTADPGAGGSATTNEATYTDYARIALPKNGTTWDTASAQAENAVALAFPEAGAGSPQNVITHFAIVSTASGAGVIRRRGALTASRIINAGITPQFGVGELVFTEGTALS